MINALFYENINSNQSNIDDSSIEITESLLIEELGLDLMYTLAEADSPELSLLVREGILNERSIVKLDRRAKKSKALTQAAFQIAKENNDKDFRKLVTVWKVRRALENKIIKKYNARASQRVRSGKKKLEGPAASKVIEKLKKFKPMNISGLTNGLKMKK